MRIGLKSKLTALISVLVLLVALAISVLYISTLSREVLAGVRSRGEYVVHEVFRQAQGALAKTRLPPGTDRQDFQRVTDFVKDRLARDPGLATLLQSEVGYSPTINYVCITDTQGGVIVADDPSKIGRLADSVPPVSELMAAGPIRQLRAIFGRTPRKYEFVLLLSLSGSGKPMGAVRVGVSTILLADQIKQAVKKPLLISALAILLATVSAGLLSFRILRPLETIALGVERMTRGEADAIQLDRTDEWGILSSKLNLLGERMRGEKAAFVALKDNLDQLFSNLTDGLLLFDNQNRLVLATPAVARFLGQQPEQLIHHSASEIFSGNGPLVTFLRDVLRVRRSVFGQVVQLPQGSETPRVSVSVHFAGERQQNVVALVTLRDATTRAQLEDQLDVTAKLAALGKLTSGVAHEVKNPLNAMVLQVEILKAKLGDQEQQVKPQLEILSSEIRRLDRVVRTFLDFNRPVELHPTETDVRTLVSEIFALAEPHARKNNVQLVLEPNGELSPVQLDRDLMKQALLNLVLNGCQAMPSGGQLKVAPHALPNRVELEIADQGVGIPVEARPRIFSLYFTTKPNGSGMGLAMAYRIIQLHNGSIEFSSEVNQGTTFRVSLPK